jgi:transcriptional regulator with XRE-family HTH domain
LIRELIDARNAAGLTQAEVARRLNRYQSFVATIEAGQRRIDLVEFLDLARAIGFRPDTVIRRLAKVMEK